MLECGVKYVLNSNHTVGPGETSPIQIHGPMAKHRTLTAKTMSAKHSSTFATLSSVMLTAAG
jgi:hypothetical protein